MILPDNDEAGEKHARQVSAALAGVAADVRILRLPDLADKGDAFDWIAAGGTREELLALAADAPIEKETAEEPRPSEADVEADQEAEDKTQAGRLIRLAHEWADFWHTADEKAYATIRNGPRRTLPLSGRRGFMSWLQGRYYQAVRRTPSGEARATALSTLEAIALHDGPTHEIAVRGARHGEAIYLDLADDSWQAIEITASGWRLTADPPVFFRRAPGMKPLPNPVAGGSLDELRPFLNLPDENARTLLAAWLVAALIPGIACPILILQGGQGTAKTTAARLIRSLIDPSVSPAVSPPKDGRDLVIAASNSWILALDNVSGIPGAISDAICRLVTGGGFRTRALYADDEERLFDARRPIILNGIDCLPGRGDLAERAIVLTLEKIEEDARLDEDDLAARFEAARPRILGALLSAVSTALARRPAVRLTRKPRMADFALWATAAEPALGLPDGAVMAAYRDNRAEAVESALEIDPVAGAIRALLAEADPWEGSIASLLACLAGKATDDARKGKAWPGSHKALGIRLRRLAPDLAATGIEVRYSHSETKRTWKLAKNLTGKNVSEASDVSGPTQRALFEPDTSAAGSVRIPAMRQEAPDTSSPRLTHRTSEASSARSSNGAAPYGTDASDTSNPETFGGDLSEERIA